MPSTWSSRFRLNFQAPGENLNTWGVLLNGQVFQLLEDAIAKRVSFSLSGSKTLTTANGATDEARSAFLDVTSGTGGTITIPPLEKIYLVRNASSGAVVVTTGAGSTATAIAGEICWVVSDASNVRKVVASDFGGVRVTSVGAPTAPSDATNKAYVDAMGFGAVELPGQAGNAGKFLNTDGVTATWEYPAVASISDYASDQAARTAVTLSTASALAVAFAVAL